MPRFNWNNSQPMGRIGGILLLVGKLSWYLYPSFVSLYRLTLCRFTKIGWCLVQGHPQNGIYVHDYLEDTNRSVFWLSTRKDTEAVVQIFNCLFLKKCIFLKRKSTELSTGGMAARKRAGLSQVQLGESAGEEAGGVVLTVPSFRRWLCMRESTTRVLEDSPREPALLWVAVFFLCSSCLRKKTVKPSTRWLSPRQTSPRPRGVNVSSAIGREPGTGLRHPVSLARRHNAAPTAQPSSHNRSR